MKELPRLADNLYQDSSKNFRCIICNEIVYSNNSCIDFDELFQKGISHLIKHACESAINDISCTESASYEQLSLFP